ncbi:spermatogenesis-associated protein 31D1-like [Panthera pardus]|uniref:Spermatogenesis-associated protein 31D1-like n=1 Tax=Panthera pardus TaxID=9691 RepID=A0A9W2VZB2_PANPR|nr:spermatogenesis-associated protein 31D1-like [Panthera pardus]
MKKRMPFQILEKKEKEEGPFSKHTWPEYQRTSSVNSLQPFDVQVTAAPKTGWNVEGKPEHLRICQQLLDLKCLGENLYQKYSQLVWGLPSLHSESLVATLLVSTSTSPLGSHFVLFNGCRNASAVKMQDQEVLLHPHSHRLPLPGLYSRPWPQNLSQSQPLPFTQVNPQAHLQPRLPIIPYRSIHASIPGSIIPGHFHITCEPQEKLEFHGPRKITILEPSFLDPDTRRLLEAHTVRFRMSQRWGLLLRVLESIKFCMLREATTWPLPHLDIPSSAMHISLVDSKAEFSNPRERSSKTFHGNRRRTPNSVPTLDHSLPAMSPMGNEGQRALKASLSDTNHEFAQGIQTAAYGSQTFQSLTHSIIAQVRQRAAVLDSRCGPEVPPKQAEAGHEPKDENVSPGDGTEMAQGRVMVQKNLDHVAKHNLSRGVFNTEELCTLQSQSREVLTTSELESSKMTNVSLSKVEAVPTTEQPSPKTLAPQDSKLSDLKRQLLSELKLKL